MELTASQSDGIDAAYYEVAKPGTVAETVMTFCRRRMFRCFMDICAPVATETIVDVGVSDVVETGDNMLERLYPYPAKITAVGRGHGRDFRHRFPESRFVGIGGSGSLPFDDDSFDIAVSNAVLEHVGSPQAQKFLLSEMLRVAPRVFVTIPNRYFPVEHHTGLPFVAASDRLFRVACRLVCKQKWADPAMLILMDRAALAAAAPVGTALPGGVSTVTGYTGLVAGGLSSNIYLFMDRRPIERRSSIMCPQPVRASSGQRTSEFARDGAD
ncbi:MAG: methyltransferase domain-containing protein [Acidiphilium sp.]|nr:methyltransferase domain-containing protein [Acidiphilium sp.]